MDISQFENMPLWKTTRGFYANITAGPTTQPILGFSSTEFNSWDASNPSEDEGFSSGTSYTLSNYGGINGLNMTIMANFDHEFGTGGTNSFAFKNTGAATSNAKITISFNGGVEMFGDLRSTRDINISASSISNPLAGTINTTEITDGTPGETFTSFTIQIDENLDTNRYWELFSLWNKLQFTNFGAAPPQNLNAPPTHIAVQYTNGTDFSYQIINLNDPADIAAEGTGSTLPATWDNAQEDDFSIRWSSQTNGGVYLVNDLVNYNGVLYKNITGTNSDTTPDADITNWELTSRSIATQTEAEEQDLGLATSEALMTPLRSLEQLEKSRETDHFRISDATETSKRIQFDVSSISTSTTRSISMPDEDISLVDADRIGAKEYDATKTYLLGQLITRANGIYKNILAITTPEVFNSTKWEKIAMTINPAILGITDAASAPPTVNTGDRYALTNTASLVAGWGTLAGLEDNDIVVFDGTDWNVTLDVSQPSNTGSYQVYNTGDTTLYYYNGSTWTSFGSGGTSEMNAVPLWKSNTAGGTYNVNDLVNYNGVLYKNLTGTNTDVVPETDGTNWFISSDHPDTSSQVSVDNSGNRLIQDVTLDTYGHVTGLSSKTLYSSQSWKFNRSSLLGGNGTLIASLPYSIHIYVNSSMTVYITTTNTGQLSGDEDWGYASFEVHYGSGSRRTGIIRAGSFDYVGQISRQQSLTLTIIPPGDDGFTLYNRLVICRSYDNNSGFIFSIR